MITNSKKTYLWSTALSILFVSLIAMDIWSDYSKGSSAGHLVAEIILLSIGAIGFIYSLKHLIQKNEAVKRLQKDILELEREKQKWQEQSKSLLDGLSKKIQEQFLEWNLTNSEIEVGFLLVKGLSQSEIASIRGTNIKTVQHQCQSLYKKAKTSGRAELSAFFLEDLLPPREENPNQNP